MTLHRIKLLTKPFWVPAITVYYFLFTDHPSSLVLFALFFGWIGDLFLMRSRKKWFIAGALSFLVGHIFYIIVLFRTAGGLNLIMQHPLISGLTLLPYLAYLIFLKHLLGQNVSSVFLVTASYISVLVVMSYFALLRVWNVSASSFLLCFSGSILFIISDTFIGYRNFKRKFKGIGTIIVITYITAQVLIISGLL